MADTWCAMHTDERAFGAFRALLYITHGAD